MKKTTVVLFFAAAVSASAASVWVNASNEPIERPNSIGGTANPTDAQLAEHNIREVNAPDVERRFWIWTGSCFTSIPQLEIDAALAAEAAEQAAAEAAASLPLQSATGFAVQDSDGHWIELEPTGDGLPVIGVQISNSPLTPEERAAMKAERKAAHDALKAATQDKKLNDKAKVALLMKAVFGVEE